MSLLLGIDILWVYILIVYIYIYYDTIINY